MKKKVGGSDHDLKKKGGSRIKNANNRILRQQGNKLGRSFRNPFSLKKKDFLFQKRKLGGSLIPKENRADSDDKAKRMKERDTRHPLHEEGHVIIFILMLEESYLNSKPRGWGGGPNSYPNR